MVQKSFVLSGLLTALLAVSAAGARTFTTYSNKNILRQRSANINLAMEYSSSHPHLFSMQPETIRTHLLFTPFFQASQRAVDLGSYFGVGNGTNSFTINTIAGGAEVSREFIIHENPRTASTRVSLKPEQQSYGARIAFFQDMNSPIKGMFFRASSTAQHLENNLKVAYTDSVPGLATTDLDYPTFFAGKGNSDSTVAGVTRNQSGLSKARIPGGRRTKTGLADIDLSLGYKCIQTATSHAFLSADITVPTGTRVLGDYVFAPVIGNGRHFGLGASFDGGLEVWKNENSSLRFDGAIRYKYLFQNNEMRTLSLKQTGRVNYNNASKYYLVGTKNAPAGTALMPLANISTLPIAVRPGHQLDMLAAMSFNSGKFTIDVGYNPFWQDAESVRLNSAFDDSRYAVAERDFVVSTRFSDVPANAVLDVTRDSFDMEGIRTPASMTHKVFLASNYAWRIYGKSLMSIGLGASYEFATSNADVEQYGFWGKLNFSF
jgi:hypothetical protein